MGRVRSGRAALGQIEAKKTRRAVSVALRTEAVNELLAGDLAAGRALLRDYINAPLGFERLGAEVECFTQEPATHA